MSIVLYYGSGSPYAWRVQLALEHKALPYERKVLSFSTGDTRKPEFLALNPRHQVPVLTYEDFVLYESNAIVEYLDEAFAGRGAPLFPSDVRSRAIARRLILEIDNYLNAASDGIWEQAFGTEPDQRDPAVVTAGEEALRKEFALLTSALRGDFLVGSLSAADYALYPLLAGVRRCERKLPGFSLDALLTPELLGWMQRIEALPYFEATVPPHWKAG
ncbi:MAG: glutathione S-transferase family protein [Casimicrobiaceae bacterium]